VNRILPLLLLLLALLPATAAAQPAPHANHIAVSLAGESAAGGRDFDVVFEMRPEAGWHGYWENPGDAGVATRVEWRLPDGVTAGPLAYPVPQRLLISGLMNYVYESQYGLVTRLRVPASYPAGRAIPVTATLDYLACTDKICVPETATVSAVLTPGPASGRLDRYRQALPPALTAPALFERVGAKLRIAIPAPEALQPTDAYFFPLTEDAIDYAAPQRVSRNGQWLIVEAAAGPGRPAAVEGVFALGGGQGVRVTAQPGTVPPAGTPVGGEAPPAKSGGAVAILLALGGALLGGLLLNIMPCVFPILSLKALSLARAGGDERAARRDALAYTAGVVLVCVALGAALLAVRAGGAAVGWAFQLQDPRVTLFLLLLVTAIALNLAGLFELPAIGGGERLAGKSGAAGSFWTGALAAFVTTPCTGPFMGAALGAALVLPSAAALAIFAGLGLGLALPFLLLGFLPALRRRLPRPGPWMNRFRRILAVPMALTALWLAWLLWRQAGNGALAVGCVAAAAVGLALWWGGRRHAWLWLSPAALAVAAGLLLVPTAAAPAGASAMAGAEPFSEARLAALRAEGRPVFVYFTADWCLTCKVNEKAVLEQDEVASAFARGKVAVMVGDWTRGNAEIGRFLEKQGRSGVPLYLWYAPGKEADVLPQILTVGRVTALAS
jgi:DsbC/DsbD-like thiol-disulfide interchange protein/cytochrome c biogenesis protein CcdA